MRVGSWQLPPPAVDHPTPRALLDTITAPGFSLFDQWQAQLLAVIALDARVGLHSDLDPDEVKRAHLEAVRELGARLREELARRGPDAPIVVLPEGPMTIPYLQSS